MSAATQTETQRIIEFLEKLLEAIEDNTQKLTNLTKAVSSADSSMGILGCDLSSLREAIEANQITPPK